MLAEFGIEIGGGLGDFKGKVWRIGLMGFSSRANNVLLFLAALEQCLLAQGAKIAPGAGVAAANRAYAYTGAGRFDTSPKRQRGTTRRGASGHKPEAPARAMTCEATPHFGILLPSGTGLQGQC